MAGGVALNCVANGRLLREGPFEDIWIQPAAGDAGGWRGGRIPRSLSAPWPLTATRCRALTSAGHDDETIVACPSPATPHTKVWMTTHYRIESREFLPKTKSSAGFVVWNLAHARWAIVRYRRCAIAGDAADAEPENQVLESFRPFAPSVT